MGHNFFAVYWTILSGVWFVLLLVSFFKGRKLSVLYTITMFGFFAAIACLHHISSSYADDVTLAFLGFVLFCILFVTVRSWRRRKAEEDLWKELIAKVEGALREAKEKEAEWMEKEAMRKANEAWSELMAMEEEAMRKAKEKQ